MPFTTELYPLYDADDEDIRSQSGIGLGAGR